VSLQKEPEEGCRVKRKCHVAVAFESRFYKVAKLGSAAEKLDMTWWDFLGCTRSSEAKRPLLFPIDVQLFVSELATMLLKTEN
jgi:hypothetical protein